MVADRRDGAAHRPLGTVLGHQQCAVFHLSKLTVAYDERGRHFGGSVAVRLDQPDQFAEGLPKASARAHPVQTSDAGFMNVTTPELSEYTTPSPIESTAAESRSSAALRSQEPHVQLVAPPVLRLRRPILVIGSVTIESRRRRYCIVKCQKRRE